MRKQVGRYISGAAPCSPDTNPQRCIFFPKLTAIENLMVSADDVNEHGS